MSLVLHGSGDVAFITLVSSQKPSRWKPEDVFFLAGAKHV